jgi:hypothetical protein
MGEINIERFTPSDEWTENFLNACSNLDKELKIAIPELTRQQRLVSVGQILNKLSMEIFNSVERKQDVPH